MRLYVEVAIRSFQRHLAYRSATLAAIFTNSIFGVIIASSYIALYGARDAEGSVAGFNVDEIVTYVWFGQAMIAVVAMWGWWEIAITIQSGDVVSDLMKPFDYYAFWLSRDAGRAACQFLIRMVPTLAIGGLLYDLALPSSASGWLAFGLSLILAVAVSFGFRFLANLAAFWLIDRRGINYIAYFATVFFGGMLVPITFFPDWLRVIAESLPFRAMFLTPIQVALGQVAFRDAVLLQVGWVAVLTLLGRLLMAKAIRKLEVQGG
jgi:ABC-2 type transport system permease protein